MKKLIALVCLGFGLTSHGALLEFQGTALKQFDESGVKVPYYPEARLKLPQGAPAEGVRLQATGAGLREKKIVILNVNVYLATHYADVGPKLGAEPLSVLRQAKYRALQLTMLRDLDAEKIRGAFADSLKENSVDPKSPGMASLLNQISFDVKKGETITFAGHTLADGTQSVVYELQGRTFQAKGPGLADDFWSIWFGKPADGGLERLKKALSSGT
jgi:hypothetical protein